MKLGYNTNGLAHHRLIDAIDLLADVGYRSVAITLDAGALDPYSDSAQLGAEVARVRDRLEARGLDRVIETGARFLLNPRRKHDPTLVDPDPARRAIRADFLRRAIDIAQALGAPVVSIWSGTVPDGACDEAAFDRLVTALEPILDHARGAGVLIGFEPEPGMFIDRCGRFAQLAARLPHPALRMTMDVGHVHCTETGDVAAHVHAWAGWIVNVHIEDMVRGVHEHLPFGRGEMRFLPIMRALRGIGYGGGLHVELSRESHRAADAVVESYNFLAPLLTESSQ